MFDTRCLDLAEHFLGDDVPATDENKKRLAQHIQDAIEGWLGYEADHPGEA